MILEFYYFVDCLLNSSEMPDVPYKGFQICLRLEKEFTKEMSS